MTKNVPELNKDANPLIQKTQQIQTFFYLLVEAENFISFLQQDFMYERLTLNFWPFCLLFQVLDV